VSIASDLMSREFVTRDRCHLLCEIGSGAHGLALAGTDDHDEMGVICEPKEYIIGLRKWETTVCRTRADGTLIPDDERSGPGDTDLVIHSLRKWVSLALNGNPTIIALLYAPQLQRDRVGLELVENGHRLLSRRALSAYLGYLTQQKERLLGQRGQKRTKRPELVEAHGYDTKYAAHALRLGWQGCELAMTGRLRLPMAEPERAYLLDVRRGEIDFLTVLKRIVQTEKTLERFKEGKLPTVLQEQPDREWANRFLVWAYESSWQRRSW
jgi:hypothetical protein